MDKNKFGQNKQPMIDVDNTLLSVANTEAGTDIDTLDENIQREAEINSGVFFDSGVTKDAPYGGFAKYKMVSQNAGNKDQDNDDLIDTQNS